MAFFEQIGRKLSDAGQGVAQSGRNAMDTVRLNNLINDRKKLIATNFSSLGEAYFTSHRDDPDNEFPQLVSTLNGLYDEIKNAEEEIKQIRGIVKCPSCGADVALGAAFCSACGAPLPEQPRPAAPAGTRQCPQCGKVLSQGTKFCTACGCKLED